MRRREHKVSYLSSEAIFAIPAMKPSKVILSLLVCGSLMLSDVYYESSFKIRGYAQDLFMPLRLILTGKSHGPELKYLLPLFDRDEILQKLGKI